jgi:hypothetical protein
MRGFQFVRENAGVALLILTALMLDIVAVLVLAN